MRNAYNMGFGDLGGDGPSAATFDEPCPVEAVQCVDDPLVSASSSWSGP
jgi:hypothetical protein